MHDSKPENYPKDSILMFKPETLPVETLKYDNLILNFYADWNHQSHAFATEFAQAEAEVLAMGITNIKFGKVDASSVEVSRKLDISEHPNVNFYQKGKMTEYSGTLTKRNIVNYVLKETGHLIKDLTCSEIDAKVKQNDFNLVHFGPKSGDSWEMFHLGAGETD